MSGRSFQGLASPSYGLLLLFGLAGAGGLTGCSPGQYFAQPARVEEITLTVRDLKTEQAALGKRVEAIESTLAKQQALLARNNADQNAQLESLMEKLREISSRIAELGDAPRRSARSTYQRPPDDTNVVPMPADSAAGTGDSAPNMDPQQLYDSAYKDVMRGSYALAVSSFQEFLRLFPDHPLADNSQYWLGECAYTQNDIPGAMTEFNKVAQNYPDGDKVPAALLKLGYCALRQNDTALAKKTFNDLITRFPDTEEARSARQKLATLN